MTKYAVLVGLTRVDAKLYGGWNGQSGCMGCELDVHNVKKVLEEKQFVENDIVRLYTQEATAENVLQALNVAAMRAQPGDLFVFYYSGHGGQLPDLNSDEDDKKDETLVCFNRQLVDDELGPIWKKFAPGVRIVMLSDSCNSGSNFRSGPPSSYPIKPIEIFNKYDDDGMRAMLIHIGACRDGATSDGYQSGGLFTQTFCNLYGKPGYNPSFQQLHDDIVKETSSKGQQIAQYNEYGPTDSPEFDLFRKEPAFSTLRDMSMGNAASVQALFGNSPVASISNASVAMFGAAAASVPAPNRQSPMQKTSAAMLNAVTEPDPIEESNKRKRLG